MTFALRARRQHARSFSLRKPLAVVVPRTNKNNTVRTNTYCTEAYNTP